jgi:hypothetical protein
VKKEKSEEEEKLDNEDNYRLALALIAKVLEAGRIQYYHSRILKYPSQASIQRFLQQYINTLATRRSPTLNLTACVCMVTRATQDDNKRNPVIYQGSTDLREFDDAQDQAMIERLAKIATNTFPRVQKFHQIQNSTKQIKYTMPTHAIAVLIKCQTGHYPKLPRVEGLQGRLPSQDLMLECVRKYLPQVKNVRYLTRTIAVFTSYLASS